MAVIAERRDLMLLLSYLATFRLEFDGWQRVREFACNPLTLGLHGGRMVAGVLAD